MAYIWEKITAIEAERIELVKQLYLTFLKGRSLSPKLSNALESMLEQFAELKSEEFVQKAFSLDQILSPSEMLIIQLHKDYTKQMPLTFSDIKDYLDSFSCKFPVSNYLLVENAFRVQVQTGVLNKSWDTRQLLITVDQFLIIEREHQSFTQIFSSDQSIRLDLHHAFIEQMNDQLNQVTVLHKRKYLVYVSKSRYTLRFFDLTSFHKFISYLKQEDAQRIFI